MTALWITLIIIALVVILFSVHIKAKLCFSIGGDNTIDLQYGFLKFRISPKKAGKEIVKGAEEEAGEKPEKPKKKQDVKKLVRLGKAVYTDLKDGLFKVLGYIIKRAVTIHELNITADYGFDDPMKTGVATGAANAAVYNIIGLLERHMKLKKWSVSLNPDFEEKKMKAGMYCVLGTNVWHILALGGILITFAVKILYKVWRVNRNEQSGK